MLQWYLRAVRRPPTILSRVSAITSLPFGMLVTLRSMGYDLGLLPVHRLARPVISVGNLTWGGEGKTPVVEFLARRLMQSGRKPAVLCRGWGAQTGQSMNDEARMLTSHVPDLTVAADPDRWRAGQVLLSRTQPPDILLLDDGFQHRQLHRDLDILVVRLPHPCGNRNLIPAGPLREPLYAGRRAHLLWTITAAQANPDQIRRDHERIRRWWPDRPIIQTRLASSGWIRWSGERLAPEAGAGKRGWMLCGVARPDLVADQLRADGVTLRGQTLLSDHAGLTADGWEQIRRQAKINQADWIVITEKDRFRFHPPADLTEKIVSLETQLEIEDGQEALDARLAGI